jgi:mannobiose 2-epimerase
MHAELVERIVPYWMETARDRAHGGTIGSIGEDGTSDAAAPKGSILHARVLWTFASTHRRLGGERLRRAADRCAAHFAATFVDPTFGGVFWMTDAAGRPVDTRKHVYAQAFAIYALAEHARATGDAHSLASAIALHRLVEARAHDDVHGGYVECFARDWTPLADVRLGDTDLDAPRSMNTHLHVLEAYTTLLAAWPDAALRELLRGLVELFLDRIVASAGDRTFAFLTETWEPRTTAMSFGHDIEASWLLVEAARTVGDASLLARAEVASLGLASSVLVHGVDRERGGVYCQCDAGRVDTDKEWWPQAEAIVGFLAAYQLTGDEAYLEPALATWRFVERHLLDRAHGDWLRRVSRDGTESRLGEKVGPWKCPYHTARACLEVMERVDTLLAPAGEHVGRAPA